MQLGNARFDPHDRRERTVVDEEQGRDQVQEGQGVDCRRREHRLDEVGAEELDQVGVGAGVGEGSSRGRQDGWRCCVVRAGLELDTGGLERLGFPFQERAR